MAAEVTAAVAETAVALVVVVAKRAEAGWAEVDWAEDGKVVIAEVSRAGKVVEGVEAARVE